MLNRRSFHNEAGNTVLIVLAVVVVAAIGGLAYFSGKIGKTDAAPAAQTAEAPAATDTQQADAESQSGIKEGNPVVAKFKGGEVTRAEVFNFIQTQPPQTRQLPLEKLYPMALEQVINGKIIADKTKNVNLDSNEKVKRQMAEAREQITRFVYLEEQVEKRLTDERTKKLYDEYVAKFPNVDEIKARHILVKDEAKAKDMIKQLDKGGNFEELAKANSTDATAKSGGDVGYFIKDQMIPAFSDAAFATAVGTYSKKPVKTDFGYHIIKVEDKRKRQPPTYEEAKIALQAQVREQILAELIQEWRNASGIERFDINGNAIEPSSGDVVPAAPAAAPAAPAARPAE
ncbi:MAG: peptidylprolyl isomerase [Alphaproteobacteria bacterium]